MCMEYKHRRDIIGKFYKSKEWRNIREGILMRDNYLCCHCGQPATEVHHIIHLTETNVHDPAVSMNPANLVSLCWKCHRAEHKNDDGRQRMIRESNPYTFDANGMLILKE